MSCKSRHGWFRGTWKQHLCNVTERRHGNQHLLSVTEKVSRKATWKERGAQRHGKASWKALLVERHGKAIIECVVETARRVASRKGVMQTDSCGASRNSRYGMRNGKHQRSQNVALSECHGKVVMDGFMESNTCATSWKGVTEINICFASRKRCHGKRH